MTRFPFLRNRKSRKGVQLLGCLIILGLILLLFPPRWGFQLAEHFFPGALYFVSTSDKVVALTIDDGPYFNTTTEILECLEQYQVKATFFMLSDAISGQEETLNNLIQSGHELGNHMTEDEASIQLSDEDFEAKLLKADQILSGFLSSEQNGSQKHQRWLRPGMGWYNSQMIATAQKHGYRLALGSVFPYDTHVPSVPFAKWFILANVQPGDIIVLHDGERRGARTARLLKNILPKLQNRGYEIVTLSELIKREGPL